MLKKKIRSIVIRPNNYNVNLEQKYTEIVSEIICNKLTLNNIEVLLERLNYEIDNNEYKTT